jgi:hypothetical protein
MKGTIEKVSSFMGKTYNEEQINKLAEHMKFDNFKNNPTVNHQDFVVTGALKEQGKFIRKGN